MTLSSSTATVHIRDNQGQLQALSARTARQILEAVSRGLGYVIGDTDSSWCGTRDSRYVYDLNRMVRFDACTGKTQTIIIEISWASSRMKTIMSHDKSLGVRRSVLEMAIHRIRTKPMLASILASKGLTTCKIRENPYLRSNQTSYKNFITTLMTLCDGGDAAKAKRFSEHIQDSDVFLTLRLVCNQLENARIALNFDVVVVPAVTNLFVNHGCLAGNILKAAESSTSQKRDSKLEKGGLKIVFHGTNKQVMDKILKGLDPSYRASNLREDYFGIEYTTSQTYTVTRTPPLGVFDGEHKVLVFIVALGKSAKFTPASGYITAASNSEELPIAEVTWRSSPSVPPDPPHPSRPSHLLHPSHPSTSSWCSWC